ncbi:Acetyltransferase (isoleucine patch superfamily) [Mycolicibacterium rutilum]|uniref:Acetyltransferase (Isoleucine patch superfamily) n=1 Tax=Mycolicibacterium rutilum TaxID=370526 RepID=A0A1H6M0W9_MYCRU|nr:acyltransferase [Mycolicibacterium rutilum]SEH91074.1 Acetyltransferase (isoleucine patch superfamily) [Mycolicibacterium rutilum]
MPKEPDTADPEDVARKVAAAPTLKIPPPPEWVYNDEGRVIDILQEGMTFRRKLFNYLAELGYNLVFGHLPSQRARQGFLRRCGADIGKRTKIGRNTKVLNIEFLTIGDDTVIGPRCLLDARGGLWIGDNVEISDDVHLLGGGHDINHPDFLPVPIPTVVEDHVWIGNRAMILPSLIHRGAVVSAHSLVIKDIAELDVVAGNPAKPTGKRSAEALRGARGT